MVELRLDQGAALGRAAGALDDKIVAVDRNPHAAARKAGGDRGKAVAFLDPQLGEAAHHGASAGAGRGDREDRVFVDHPRGPLGGDFGAGKRAGPRTNVSHRLAALFAAVHAERYRRPSRRGIREDRRAVG